MVPHTGPGKAVQKSPHGHAAQKRERMSATATASGPGRLSFEEEEDMVLNLADDRSESEEEAAPGEDSRSGRQTIG